MFKNENIQEKIHKSKRRGDSVPYVCDHPRIGEIGKRYVIDKLAGATDNDTPLQDIA